MWNKLANASAVATLLGVGVTSFLSDAYKSHIAFAAFIFALLFITWRLSLALKAWQLRNYPKGYVPTATFIRYRTGDGRNYLYEAFRYIQIKTAFKKTFEHNFFWTGTKKPLIRSSLQTVGPLIERASTQSKTVTLNFKEYRFYNDTEIVHVEMQLDDSDQASKPFVCAAVDSPMRYIHFRVELLHYMPKDFGRVATLERRELSANEHAEFATLQQINFDGVTKSYDFILPHPDPGFQYRLRWDRAPLKQSRGTSQANGYRKQKKQKNVAANQAQPLASVAIPDAAAQTSVEN